MSHHIGAPATAIVKKDDVVKVGTKIAEAGGFVSAAIFSSVSGKVNKVDSVIDASGYRKPAIFIDVEGDEWEESIDDYMTREVLPHVPDAKAFFEEDLGKKKPVIKTGAEIPFTRYFYKYQQPTPSEELEAKFMDLELSVSDRVSKLFE